MHVSGLKNKRCMKKWNEYTLPEKRMIVVIGILLVLILLTFGRVDREIRKGFGNFFSSSAPTTVQDK